MSKSHRRRKRNAENMAAMEKTYQQCLERERKREYKYRHTKQGSFESGFVRYEQLFDDPDAAQDKLRCASSLGAVITSAHDIPVVVGIKSKLDHACQKLRRHGLGHLVRTLQLIAKNGKNREESIWQLMMDCLKSKDGRTMRHGKYTGKTAIACVPFSGSKTPPKSTHPKKK